MLTLFSIPKPFAGRTAEVQLNALRSWVALGVEVQVVLLGDDAGIAEAAANASVDHVPTLLCNEQGVPRLDSSFARVNGVARYPIRCFVNADIVLLDDFLPAVRRAAAAAIDGQFLMVGSTVDLEGITPLDSAASARLRTRATAEGVARGAAAIDYFVFPAGLFDPMPHFTVGRAGFDNWMIWQARQRGPVIDATEAVVAIHQSHDYAHLEGGKAEAYAGEEAARNIDLAGGRGRMYTLHDASHRMRADGSIVRNYGSILRSRETARKIAWKLGRR